MSEHTPWYEQLGHTWEEALAAKATLEAFPRVPCLHTLWFAGYWTRESIARASDAQLRTVSSIGPQKLLAIRAVIPYEPGPDLAALRLAVVEAAKEWRAADLARDAYETQYADYDHEAAETAWIKAFEAFSDAVDALIEAEGDAHANGDAAGD